MEAQCRALSVRSGPIVAVQGELAAELMVPRESREQGEFTDVVADLYGLKSAGRQQRIILDTTLSQILQNETSDALPAHLLPPQVPAAWYKTPVGRGEFTCCRLCHKLPDGTPMQCDLPSVGAVLQKMSRRGRALGGLHFRAERNARNPTRASETV